MGMYLWASVQRSTGSSHWCSRIAFHYADSQLVTKHVRPHAAEAMLVSVRGMGGRRRRLLSLLSRAQRRHGVSSLTKPSQSCTKHEMKVLAHREELMGEHLDKTLPRRLGTEQVDPPYDLFINMRGRYAATTPFC